MSQTRHRIFVTVAPGLEELLQRELEQLGLPAGQRTDDRGGVELSGHGQVLWRVLLCSRLAESVRVRLGQPFRATGFEQLQRRVERLPWAAYLRRGGARPRIRASCHGSRLYHTGAVEQRVGEVLQRRLQLTDVEPAPGAAATVHARVVEDQVQLSVDASGELLHRRGYRTHVGRAPLRETLAAACLRAAGYSGAQPLWDPFCGAGTICIEAAGMAAGRAPGLDRRFALESWPVHDAQGFARLRRELEQARPDRPAAITGSDVSARAVAAAEHNAQGAGQGGITLRQGDFEAQAERIEAGSWIVTNPPFGRRLALGARGDLERLGALLRRRRDLRSACFLMASAGVDTFVQQTGLSFESLITFLDGGLRVQLLRIED